jgi:hypothetical protein
MKIELECSATALKHLNDGHPLVYDDVDDMPPVVLISKETFRKLLERVSPNDAFRLQFTGMME